MNQVLPSPLPLGSDDSFLQEQDCAEPIGAHAHHHAQQQHQHQHQHQHQQHPQQHHGGSFAGVPELKREMSSLGGHSPSGSHMSSSIAAGRCPSYRPEASFLHAGPGPLSTSPNSHASPLMNFLPTNPASSHSNFTYSSPLTGPNNNNTYSTFNTGYGSTLSSNRPSSIMTDSSSAMLPPARSSGLGNPVSPPPLGASARDTYASSTPSLPRHSYNLVSPHAAADLSRYSNHDTPRSQLAAPIPLVAFHPAPSMAYTQAGAEGDSPPFHLQEDHHTITADGNKVQPILEVKIEKGFFLATHDRTWTCYRRNYFSVNSYFTLSPWPSNVRLYVSRDGSSKPPEQVQAFAISLQAAIDGQSGKAIDLVQHTPKRDKGPQIPMKKELVAPTPPGKSHEHSNYSYTTHSHQGNHLVGPLLPLQNQSADHDGAHHYSPASHTGKEKNQHLFERIQFKYATANNGKRRAQQQYYHLVLILWANIQGPRDVDPKWVKVCSRISHPVVVRGRSPSHYKDEGPHNAHTSRGTGSGGMGGAGFSLGSGFGLRNNLSGGGASAGMSNSMYRGGTTYTSFSLDPSPVASDSNSSSSTMSGGPVDGLGDHQMVDEEDVKLVAPHHDYQYYPAPIFEAGPPKLEPLSQPDRRVVKEEYSNAAPMNPSWALGGCGRFQGMESSRGYYPDLHAGY